MSEDDSHTSISMDLCDDQEMDHHEVAAAATGVLQACPVAAVHFDASTTETAASREKGYYIPLEKVGKNYRSLRRRGAAVHSQLLKNAFEASLSSYDSDGDDDDYSMYASNSTLASRDGVDEVNTPRKRVRHVGDHHEESEPSVLQASHLLGDMILTAQNAAGGLDPSVTSISTEGSTTIKHASQSPDNDQESL